MQLFDSPKQRYQWRKGWIAENGLDDILKMREDAIEMKNGDYYLLIVVQHPSDLNKLRGLSIDEYDYYPIGASNDAFWEAVGLLSSGLLLNRSVK